MIVLLGPDPAWRQLLAQAGLPFRVGRPDARTRVLIAPAAAGPREVTAGLGAAAPGCGLLAEAGASLPGGATPVEALAFRVEAATRVGRARVRAFPSRAPRPVVERVAARDRGEARRQVTAAVRRLLDVQSLPCARLASTPAGGATALGFRVDTDYCGRAELAQTRRLADEVGMSFSWFVNTEAHGPLLGELGMLFAGQDVQVHCHRHEVFRSVRANRENVARATAILSTHGLRAVGVASPYGDWNPSWDRALAELGLVYASDFVAGYDDLPFRPLLGDVLSPVLQVPVHPVCLGRLRAARASEDDIRDYYRRLVEHKVALREPCLLYDHPTAIAAHHALLAGILRDARAACGRTLSLTGYAEWWRRREQVRFEVAVEPDAVELAVGQGDELVEVELEFRGRHARIPLRPGRYQLTGLSWQAAVEPNAEPSARVPLRTVLSERLRQMRRQTRN
ncbi:MAG: hypothetical protein R6X12_07920 [bacterium]